MSKPNAKKKSRVTISDQLAAAIELSGLSKYRICKDTGVDEATMSKFLSGSRGMRLDSFEKLADYFDIELAYRKK